MHFMDKKMRWRGGAHSEGAGAVLEGRMGVRTVTALSTPRKSRFPVRVQETLSHPGPGGSGIWL